MEHQEACELFTAYADGELTDVDQAGLEAHLRSCDACREEWEAYRRTMEEVSGLLAVPPPPDTVRLVEKKIARRSRGRFFAETRSTGMSFAMVSFILVLFFILAYLLLTAVNEIQVMEVEPSDEQAGTRDENVPSR